MSETSIEIAASIVKKCLNDKTINPQVVKPYATIENGFWIIKGYTDVNPYHFQTNLNKSEIMGLNWFVSIDNINFCHFEDFITQVKQQGLNFKVNNISL